MPLSNCPDRPQSPALSAWETLVERRIRAAREAGQFDNLGGSGQPLQLRENPYAEPGWQVLSGVLAEANLRPAWVEESQEIRAEVLRFRERLRVTKDKQRVQQQVVRLNNMIAAFNLVVPLLHFQLPGLNLRRELRRCGVIER
ncbi:MAG: DUF1992 domain-containing protein [Anaerolineales bacterium]|jgi:hypothetical protein|nr:DUF1992 domain-containing protein [Anaerolineales bacterium]MDP7644408.1 DUF1992 domain-containing protein [Anaerolineales bacterium]HJO33433.1 DnaJ family domain-containing protein [Anaerolineales bacterium]|tara:strand:+ start:902 stop:1330 length:429 start_codon:yes stop_codon:yes gene_type:complete